MLLRDACTRRYAPGCGALAAQLYNDGPNGGAAGQAGELAKRGCEGHHLASCSLLISLARGETDQLTSAESFLLARCNGIVPEACVALGRAYAAQAIPQGDRGLMNGLFSRGCEQQVAAAKRSLLELRKNPEDRDLPGVKAMVDACFTSEDYKEGRKAFTEKRTPQFKGQ
jgi:enoyl-CoA hydratase/carnithine racemase